jgi:predicted MFS family arabinose efflux permease
LPARSAFDTAKAATTIPSGTQHRKSLNWRELFSALRHPNFRLYFIGLLISVTGSWAQTVAQEWLVYRLTGSAFMLGQVSFVTAIPVWTLSPWAGVVIDRMPRRTLLFITQAVQMLQAFALAVLMFSGRIEVWHVFVLSAVRGAANAFDAPTRQSFYIELVDRDDLSNAIALNSTLMSLARVFGPSLGGVIVAVLGTAWAFTINGITFLAILAGLALMHLPRSERRPHKQSPLADMLEGMQYIRQTRVIAGLIVIVLAVALFGASFSVLLPVIAAEVLERGEVEFGILNAMRGIGSVIGALVVAYLASRRRRGRYLDLFNWLLPGALLALALTHHYGSALLIMILIGLTLTPQISFANMLIQAHVNDDIRGRVMSVYTLVIFGTFPVGSLIMGTLAEHFGASWAIGIGAAAVFLISVGVRLSIPEIRRLE